MAGIENTREHLQERGFIEQVTNKAGLCEILARGGVPIYCGFDPTAASLPTLKNPL